MSIGLFHLVSLGYALAALATLWRLGREWRALFDAMWTPRDQQLAQMIGLLLLTPPAVWLHEVAHATALRLFGVPDPAIHFFLYWGYVTSRMPLPPFEDFAVTLAGPLVTWALGWGLLAVALLLPLRQAVALALATCAITQLVLVLVLYPAMSLLGGWGDFVGIYRDAPRPASLATGVGHAASLLAFCWLMNRAWMRGFLVYPVPHPWRLRWTAGG